MLFGQAPFLGGNGIKKGLQILLKKDMTLSLYKLSYVFMPHF